MSRRRIVVAAFYLFGLLSLLPAAAAGADTSAYKLGTGDKVRLTVFNEKDLSGEFDVNDQGLIAVPLIGQIPVRGKTIAEVEKLLTDRFGADYLVHPRLTVEVLNYRPFYIIGEVRNPGSYPFVNGMTAVNAVALAGGYTPRARKGKLFIKRANNPGGDEEEVADDAAVLPGDVLRVAERYF